jgi:hypothetical protein
LRVETQQVVVRPDAGENAKPRFDIDRGMWLKSTSHEWWSNTLKDIKAAVSPFLFLAVDLPPPPLFQDSVEKNIIPQVSIHSVLAKYDGKTTQVRNSGFLHHKYTNTTLGISWSTSAVQMPALASIYYSPLQTVYQKRFRGGEESHYS